MQCMGDDDDGDAIYVHLRCIGRAQWDQARPKKIRAKLQGWFDPIDTLVLHMESSKSKVLLFSQSNFEISMGTIVRGDKEMWTFSDVA